MVVATTRAMELGMPMALVLSPAATLDLTQTAVAAVVPIL